MKITYFALRWHQDKSASVIHFLIIKKKLNSSKELNLKFKWMDRNIFYSWNREDWKKKKPFQLFSKT